MPLDVLGPIGFGGDFGGFGLGSFDFGGGGLGALTPPSFQPITLSLPSAPLFGPEQLGALGGGLAGGGGTVAEAAQLAAQTAAAQGGAAPLFAGSGAAGGAGRTGLSGLLATALPALGAIGMLGQIPLGIMGLNVARQGQKAQQQAIAAQERAMAPAVQAAETLLPAGTQALMTGQLPPALQQQVDNQVNQVEQQMLNQLVAAGISPDTARAMIAGQLAQVRNQLTMQAAQSLLGGGFGGGELTGGLGGVAGRIGGQLQQTAQDATMRAMQSMTQLLAQQGGAV